MSGGTQNLQNLNAHPDSTTEDYAVSSPPPLLASAHGRLGEAVSEASVTRANPALCRTRCWPGSQKALDGLTTDNAGPHGDHSITANTPVNQAVKHPWLAKVSPTGQRGTGQVGEPRG